MGAVQQTAPAGRGHGRLRPRAACRLARSAWLIAVAQGFFGLPLAWLNQLMPMDRPSAPGLGLLLLLVCAAAISACAAPNPGPPTVAPPTPSYTPMPASRKLAISAIGTSTNYFNSDGRQEAAFDGDLTTGWAPGEGVLAWIQVTFPTTATVTGARLYFIAPSGSRMQTLRLSFDDGSAQEFAVADRHGWQELTVQPVATRSVRLTVLTMTDLARRRGLPVYLPELEFYGVPHNAGAPNLQAQVSARDQHEQL